MRHRETESSERFFAPAMGPKREVCSLDRICNRVILANEMPEGAPVTDIIVSKGSVYQMTSKEKKGLDWVMSETKYLLMLTLLKKVLL